MRPQETVQHARGGEVGAEQFLNQEAGALEQIVPGEVRDGFREGRGRRREVDQSGMRSRLRGKGGQILVRSAHVGEALQKLVQAAPVRVWNGVLTDGVASKGAERLRGQGGCGPGR